jgi:calcineurin-like phosphoesterase family protein
MKKLSIALSLISTVCFLDNPHACAGELPLSSSLPSINGQSLSGTQSFFQAHATTFTTLAAIGIYYIYKGARKLISCQQTTPDYTLELIPMPEQNPQTPLEDTQKTPDLKTMLQEIQETIDQLPDLKTRGYLEAHILDEGKLASIGDLHGDFQSLNIDLQNMQQLQLDPHTHFIFTGDFTDRGSRGLAIWRTIMHMIKLNPGHIHVIRGNHEARDMAQAFGFYKELQTKFGNDAEIVMNAFDELFKRLPSAKIFGMVDPQTQKIRYSMYFHGGIEDRLTEHFKKLLDQVETSHDRHAIIPFTDQEIKKYCALQWGDFCATLHPEPQTHCSSRVTPGNSIFVHNKSYARRYLQQFDTSRHTVDCIVRGHQHEAGGVVQLKEKQLAGNSFTPMIHMQPCFIEQGEVFTLTSSPGGIGQGCKEDAFAIVENTQQGLQLTPYIWSRF